MSTSIKIYVAVTEDGDNPPAEDSEDWNEATNDSSIPGVTTSADLTGKYLWVRQELSTTDTDATPRLSTLEYEVVGEDKVNFFKFF